ncbi:MAG: cytochrome b/b6 domain-containing protein [Chloroflexota bacterium]|nr:cytochrome b/b6 domain-containing protein [Chloroflexota bacterium]
MSKSGAGQVRGMAQSIPQENAGEKTKDIVRFDPHQRLQHILMMSSFVVLALTGLPLKFADLSLSQWWIGFWGGIEVTRTIHRLAAWVMVFDCIYHLAYLINNIVIKRRPFPIWIIPQPKDVFDFFLEVRYYMGLTQEKPRFDRFNFHQKFDYWAIFWGIPVMAGSGFILMYPVFFAKFLPGGIIPVALVAHSDEAVLAVAWIVVVHFFFAHLAPNVFPINWTIFTGRMSRERYNEEHPLDYQRVLAQEARQAAPPPAQKLPKGGPGSARKPPR